MSGTQSTLTDRTPNILNKDHPPDKKPKSDKSPVSLKHEFDPTGLVQRCVIIQRDENGFGLTVSGDNPVFVQLVREDGAAMRAGVQTGDRIIKVNGTLVTHSNHIEVVKLIKSGSYVALTVLGRPPGLPHIPLEEEGLRREQEEEQGEACLSSPPPSSPLLSPLLPAREEHSTSPLPPTEDNRTLLQCQNADSMQKTKEHGDSQTMKEDHSRNPQAKLLKESQEPGRNHHPLLQDQDGGSTGLWSRDGDVEEADTPLTPPWDAGSNGAWSNITGHGSPLPQSFQKEMPSHGPKITPLDGLICPSAEPQETTDLDSNPQCTVGSPSPRFIPQIIGAEDDYFDAQQEQISGQCSCFQSIESLKSRPAHLAAFLHHVVSQFDPAPLLCYLYADLHKQSSSKETRRLFMDFHSVFLDRAANLKVPVPDSIAAELERRRLDLIPEELCRQYTQQLQDTLLPDLHIKLEDFRQKRSMGLTLAEDMLCKLDADKRKEQSALDKERSCAEHIISKIEDILITSQPTEEEKCATMQYVILTYMKHLGVKVKEPRSLEPKRPRINFLPKMKKSKPEKEGEEKVKKPRFPSILGQPRRPSRVDAPSIGKAMELNKQRSPKQLVSHSAVSIPEHPDASSSRVRGSQSSDGSDSGPHLLPHPASPLPLAQLSEPSGHDSDSGLSPSSALSRLSDGVHSGDNQDSTALPNSPHFDFPCPLDQFQEDVYRMDGLAEVQSEDDQGGGVVYGEDPLNWQRLVSREVLAGLASLEIKRQEVINELLYTEGAHLRMLRVLDSVFFQRLSRDTILPPEDIKHIFTNLDQILQLHVSVTEQMTAIRKRSETSVIGPIGNDLLTWFSGEEEEKIKQAVGMFCSNQPSALELIKSRQKKDQRFTNFMQEAESNRQCRRLQLKDMIPMEMQRLAKYPLLLENIAKYTEDSEERSKVKRACECCKKILNHVNQAVKEAENKQRLEEYQRRLDLASLKQSENPLISEFKSLDLTKRKMIHEGPLSWKVNKDKTIELYTLLLEDILVLLQKQDDRLVLKCHSKNLAGNSDTKHIFSPIIKLNTVLVRSVATDNKSFFVLSMSDNGAQIYELMAQTISDQRTWQCLITQCAETMKTKAHNIIPLSQTEAEQDAIEIINTEETKPSKDSECTSPGCLQPPGIPTDGPPSPGLQAPPTNSNNPFEGDEEEEEEAESAALAEREEEGEERRKREEEEGERRRREEEEGLEERRRREEDGLEEEDEAELQAFLDGVLPDSYTAFLQETPQEGVTANHQEPHAFHMMPAATRAEEALRTLAVLKQVLLDHMKSREDAGQEETSSRTPGCLLRTVSLGNQNHQNQGTCSVSPDSDTFETGHVSKETEGAELSTGHTGIPVATENCGNYMVLDYPGGGCEESNTEDDGVGGGAQWDCEGDSDIDLKKLLSSASQTTEGGGPDLNRQIMTHLRLLQANLQHLKEVETKYNQLRQTRGETATDSDDGSDTIQC